MLICAGILRNTMMEAARWWRADKLRSSDDALKLFYLALANITLALPSSLDSLSVFSTRLRTPLFRGKVMPSFWQRLNQEPEIPTFQELGNFVRTGRSPRF